MEKEGTKAILFLLRRFPHSTTDYSSSVVNITVKTTLTAYCSYLNLVKTKVSEVGVGTILHREVIVLLFMSSL